MTNILEVLSNLRHNGVDYLKGTFLEAEEGSLLREIEDKVLRIIEGAENIEHAVEIVANEKETVAVEDEVKEVEEQNTWQARPDEDVAPITDVPVAPVEEVTAPIVDPVVPVDTTVPTDAVTPTVTDTVPSDTIKEEEL